MQFVNKEQFEQVIKRPGSTESSPRTSIFIDFHRFPSISIVFEVLQLGRPSSPSRPRAFGKAFRALDEAAGMSSAPRLDLQEVLTCEASLRLWVPRLWLRRTRSRGSARCC